MSAKKTTKTTKTKTPKATKTAKAPRAKKAKAGDERTGHAPQSQLSLEEAAKLEAARAKKAKKATAASEAKPKKLSAIDAAAQVLAETNQPMNTREMITAMGEKNLWMSPGGKTPHATLYSAILREINTKGNESRFTKTERGKFAANSAA
ncbi:MAG TPA: winged helix-turn-helix domain-containing protein [Tepidisphaeraceae bacterium]|jgi:hypothetical protein|nr:winged helix-turn-helix domain-containing protein [Tepidisphaeraceae bacterium]